MSFNLFFIYIYFRSLGAEQRERCLFRLYASRADELSLPMLTGSDFQTPSLLSSDYPFYPLSFSHFHFTPSHYSLLPFPPRTRRDTHTCARALLTSPCGYISCSHYYFQRIILFYGTIKFLMTSLPAGPFLFIFPNISGPLILASAL